MLETLLAFVAVHPIMTFIIAMMVNANATINFLIWMAIVIWIVS